MNTKTKVGQDLEVTSSSPDDHRIQKHFGYVSAYPHEYLIHFRAGQLSTKTSGQGASCFKWPRDTVFIIPTSLKEIVFQANQLSMDNVDLRLRGMAVYHIKDPMRIHTLLNFHSRQQAEEKLSGMIGDLCRSTVKWLVANMPVNECMRKRKEEIAATLKKEVSQVVADTEHGWGVEIVTIDIQDIYIQDDEIFAALQAQFKSEKLRESELIQLDVTRNLEIKRLENACELAEHRKNNEIEQARIEAEIKEKKILLNKQTEEKEYQLERFRVDEKEKLQRYRQEQEIERQKFAKLQSIDVDRVVNEQKHIANLDQLRQETNLERQRMEMKHTNEQYQFSVDHYRVEQNEAIAMYKLQQELEREQQKQTARFAQAKHETETQRIIHQEQAEALAHRIEVENNTSPASLERHFIEHALPTVAQTLAKSLGDARISIFQGGENSGLPLPMLINEVLALLKQRFERVPDKSSSLNKHE